MVGLYSATETLHKLTCQVSHGKFNMVGKRTLKLLFLLLGNSSVGSLMRVIRNSFMVLASLFSKSNCYTLWATLSTQQTLDFLFVLTLFPPEIMPHIGEYHLLIILFIKRAFYRCSIPFCEDVGDNGAGG